MKGIAYRAPPCGVVDILQILSGFVALTLEFPLLCLVQEIKFIGLYLIIIPLELFFLAMC